MRILVWDIEASNLSADFGIVLCVGSKVVGEKRVTVPTILDYVRPGDRSLLTAEKRLLRAVSKTLIDSDVWVTHFGTHYDIGFVNARLIYHGLKPLPTNHPHVDTWKISRYKLRLSSNRLATISTFLKTGDEKNKIKPEQWLGALSGNKAAMAYIAEHCRLDCLVLEEVYLRLRPLMTNHPRGVANATECHACGSKRMMSNGWRRTATKVYRRVQCKDCGAWGHDTKAQKA